MKVKPRAPAHRGLREITSKLLPRNRRQGVLRGERELDAAVGADQSPGIGAQRLVGHPFDPCPRVGQAAWKGPGALAVSLDVLRHVGHADAEAGLLDRDRLRNGGRGEDPLRALDVEIGAEDQRQHGRGGDRRAHAAPGPPSGLRLAQLGLARFGLLLQDGIERLEQRLLLRRGAGWSFGLVAHPRPAVRSEVSGRPLHPRAPASPARGRRGCRSAW